MEDPALATLRRCASADAAIDAGQPWPRCYLAMQYAASQRGLSLRAWRRYDAAYRAARAALAMGVAA